MKAAVEPFLLWNLHFSTMLFLAVKRIALPPNNSVLPFPLDDLSVAVFDVNVLFVIVTLFVSDS